MVIALSSVTSSRANALNTELAPTIDAENFRVRDAVINGIKSTYAVAGSGPAILLLHGWPFTWFTWHKVIPQLAQTHTVIAPDMRGIGATSKPASGYDVGTLADDAAALLAFEGVENATVVGHDLGVGVAYMMAHKYPKLVNKLVVMESIVLGAPRAELFMNDPPWWVAFHNVPDMPEALVAGREASYLDWFWTNLTVGRVGISKVSRDQHIASYELPGSMRGGFEHYRAFPTTIKQGREASQSKLDIPVLALGGELIGDVLFQQMKEVAGNVSGGKITGVGHVIQEERPEELLSRLKEFL